MSHPSPLDQLELTFAQLVTGPRPLALDGRDIAGLPDRDIALDELRSLLLHPATPYDARDEALTVLVRRARRGDSAWMVGLAGVLVPGLRRAAHRLGSRGNGDLDAELIAGLLETVVSLDLDRGRIAARLIGGAVNRARCAARADAAYVGRVTSGLEASTPPPPFGHPDLVLADAVAAGVLTTAEAELIGATRLEDADLRELATAANVPYDTLRRRRLRAEGRLVTWLAER